MLDGFLRLVQDRNMQNAQTQTNLAAERIEFADALGALCDQCGCSVDSHGKSMYSVGTETVCPVCDRKA